MTAFVDYTIRMSAILCVGLIAIRALRRQSAALRHLVLASAIFCAAVLPIFNRIVPSLDWNPVIPVTALPAPVQSVVTDSIRLVTVPPRVVPIPAATTPNPRPSTPLDNALIPEPAVTPPNVPAATLAPAHAIDAARILQQIYVAGTALSFGALLLCLIRLVRIEFRARDVKEIDWMRLAGDISQKYGLRRHSRLLESDSPSVLATWGVFRPIIVIPSGATRWPEDRIRIVLGHELAHVRRRDWPVQLSAEILRAIFWFNPLVWVICRRLRQESEHACDDAVLNSGMPASEYAAHLLDLARSLGNPQRSWTPALLMARPSTLEQRFVAMLNPRLKRDRVNVRSWILTLAFFLCMTLSLAALRAAPQAAVTESVQATAISTATTVRAAVMTMLQAQTSPAAPLPNSIEGIVVRLGANDTVSDVDVELWRVEGTAASPLGPLVYPPGNFSPGAVVRPSYPNPSDISNVRTKSDGKFLFTNLKPGTYRLRAARAGGAYYPTEYGQRNPRGSGYDFQFVEGQAMRDVRLQMAPTGSISGRVIDADGQPAARVRVMALEATYTAGERTLGIIQAVQTDDKGEYRLFWLPPGQYVVAARQEDPRRQTLQLFITPPGSAEGYETYPQAPLTFRILDNGTVVEETFEVVYYGGERDAKRARTVDLRPGGSLNAIDLSLAGNRVRTRHVRGTLTDPTGARIPGVTVSALPRNSGPSVIAPSAITDANGAFELSGVGTGAYILRGSLPGFAGFALLEPGDTDLDGVPITMGLGFKVPGKIFVEGRASSAPPLDLSKVTVRIENAIRGLPGSSSAALNGDTFTISAPQTGQYRVFVNPLLVPYSSDVNQKPAIPADLQNAYVKAIRMNADDGLTSPVNIAPQPGQLEVVIAFNGGSIEGVVNDRQRPAANAVIVMVPAIRSRLDLYRVSSSGDDGRFRMQGIPPGEYKAFAWEYVQEGAWYDAAFLSTHESSGKSVRITEGNNTDLSLPMERP